MRYTHILCYYLLSLLHHTHILTIYVLHRSAVCLSCGLSWPPLQCRHVVIDFALRSQSFASLTQLLTLCVSDTSAPRRAGRPVSPSISAVHIRAISLYVDQCMQGLPHSKERANEDSADCQSKAIRRNSFTLLTAPQSRRWSEWVGGGSPWVDRGVGEILKWTGSECKMPAGSIRDGSFVSRDGFG